MPVRIFPVAQEGDPRFVDDFTSRKHDGIDIFATEGTPIVAVDDGALRFAEDDKGGHAFYLEAADRVTYYGAHLAYYEGLSPRYVQAGDVVGYVGKTGNAAATSPHLHFEVHPSGGVAVNPYPHLVNLSPPVVLSSAGARDQALPVTLSPDDALPPLIAPAPVPDIPHERRGGRGGAVVVVLAAAGVVGAVVAAGGGR
jgi:murein DD-endopeptidase MepM/ murein hydrolase activator NlpD